MATKRDKIGKDENMETIEVETAFTDIFLKCDVENRGLVKVSTLIKFIGPYIESNEELLRQLTKILDPLNVNPIINYDLFSNGMKIWTSKFNDQLQSSFASEKSVPNNTEHFPIQMSTPKKHNVERGDHRNDFELLNLSNISTFSYAGSIQNTGDPMILNEQINELQYQNKKLVETLSQVKNQLITSEETNNSLQNDLERLRKCRGSDQKLIEELCKYRSEFEKEHDENVTLVKNLTSVTQSLNFYKKENCQLRKQLLDLELEFQKCQDLTTVLKNKESKLNLKYETRKQEIHIKTNEITLLKEKIEELNLLSEEKNVIMQGMNEELQNLRFDNSTLQKSLDEKIKKNTSKTVPTKPGIKYSSPNLNKTKFHCSTPKSRSLHLQYNSPILNSPRTLRMLQNPISPVTPDSPDIFSNSSKSTVIEQKISPKITISTTVENPKNTYFSHVLLKLNSRSYSETDAPNLNTHSTESETNRDNRTSKSLDPDMIFDDDCFLDHSTNSSRPQSPHESLQTELLKASNMVDCLGTHPCCEKKLKLSHYEDEIDFLQDQVQKRVEEIEVLNKKVTEINELNSNLQMQLTTMENNSNDLYKKVEQITKENTQLIADFAKTKSETKRYCRLEQKIKKLENENFDIKEKWERMVKQNSLLILQLNESCAKLDHMKQLENEIIGITKMKEENSKLKSQISELRAKSQAAEQVTECVQEEANIEKKYLSDLNSEINVLVSKINSLEKVREELEEECARKDNNSKKKINELIIKVRNMEENVFYEKNISKELSIRIEHLETINHKLEETIKSLEERKQELEHKLKEEQSSADIITVHLEKIKSQVEENRSTEETKIKELRLKVDTLKQLNDELNEKLKEEHNLKDIKKDKYNKMKQQLKEKLSKEESLSTELKEKVKEITTKLECLHKEKQELEELFKDKYLTDIKDFEQARTILENKLLTAKMNSEDSKVEIHELHLQILSLEKINFEMQKKYQSAETKIENLEKVKQELNEKYTTEQTNSNRFKLKINELITNIEILEKNQKEIEGQANKLKLQLQILEQFKHHLQQILKMDLISLDFKLKTTQLITKLEFLEKRHIEESDASAHNSELKEMIQSKDIIIHELTSTVEYLKGVKENLEKTEEELNKKVMNSEELKLQTDLLEKENKELKEKHSIEKENFEKIKYQLEQQIKDLTMKQQYKENEKQELERMFKEKYLAEIKTFEKIKAQLEEKLLKRKMSAKEMKIKINELTSNIDILEGKKSEIEQKYSLAEIKIENLEKIKQELNKKLLKEEETCKKFDDLSLKIASLERIKQELEDKLSEENDLKNLKVNEFKIKLEILEQAKVQLKEQLSTEENLTKELTIKINNMNSNLEVVEQQLREKEKKLQSLSVFLSKLSRENEELGNENKFFAKKNEKLIMSVESLEGKIQTFRRINIDLKTSKTESENNFRMISNQYDALLIHVNFAKQQIRECKDVLGKNTLLAAKAWKTSLSDVMEEFSVSEIADNSCLSGTTKVVEGRLTENLKMLKNQTRLTGILLKSLAKIKDNSSTEDDDEDTELSAVISIGSSSNVSNKEEQNISVYISELIYYPSMSPDCASTEMTEDEAQISCMDFSNVINSTAEPVFVPTPPPTNQITEIVAEAAAEAAAKPISEENQYDTNTKKLSQTKKQYRSMSEGTAVSPSLTEDGDITLFPNLQDNILESLSLHNGEQSRERMASAERLSEEEVEAKFQTLALIFAIDAKSLSARRELQRRQRNQADDNFAAEVARLQVGMQRLAPLCSDAETTEMVSALLNRLNVIVKAAQRISISTQVYGGVQQEYRIAAAVNLMLVHLRNVQQQRDTAKRQLQCTKRMLQENTCSNANGERERERESGSVVSVVTRRLSTAAVNGGLVSRRRASIATIPRPLDSPSASGPAGIAVATKRARRRISADVYTESSAKHWDCRPRPEWIPLERPLPIRSSRPSRLELGLDLSKIHEGSVESTMNNDEDESDSSELTAYETPNALIPHSPNPFLVPQLTMGQPETFSDHAIAAITGVVKLVVYCWNRWIKNGSTQEAILFATFVCFALGIVMFLNMMIMIKLIKQDTVVQRIPWNWLTWDEVWNMFFDVRSTGPRPY